MNTTMSTAYLVQNKTPSPSMLDPDNRDPSQINKHLQLDFFNIIAEPDASAYSFQIFHQASHYTYHYSKIFIYRLLTIFVGLPLMLVWGLVFGLYTFSMVWLVAPMRRLTQSFIAESGLYVQTVCDAVIGPICRSMGQYFSNIRLFVSEKKEFVQQIQI